MTEAWNEWPESASRSRPTNVARAWVGSSERGDRLGERRGDPRGHADGPAREPIADATFGADEDVEAGRQVRLYASKGASETFIPTRFGARSRSRSITAGGIG